MIKKIFYTCPRCKALFPEEEAKCWSSPEDEFGVRINYMKCPKCHYVESEQYCYWR